MREGGRPRASTLSAAAGGASGTVPSAALKRAGTEVLGAGLLAGIAVLFGALAGWRLGPGGWSLLATTFASAVAMVGVLTSLRPVSGGYMNPAITLGAAIQGDVRWNEVPLYAGAQIVGALGVGISLVWALGQPLVVPPTVGGAGLEAVAAFGLHTVYAGTTGHGGRLAMIAPAIYLGGMFWFTASGSFGNPALALAWALGRGGPWDRVLGVILAQFGGAVVSGVLWWWLRPGPPLPRRVEL
jgi:glycerol uptake facilitator-like aquaporin